MIRVVAAAPFPLRETVVALLRSDPGLMVAGEAANGAEALELVRRLKPDLLVINALLPVLDGFETTKRIMIERPTPIVILSEGHDTREVGLAMHALSAGALMVMRMPRAPTPPAEAAARADFLATIKALSTVKLVRRWRSRRDAEAAPRQTRPPRHRVVAIAASTGGPAALQRLLSALPGDFEIPILVVQHIATGFVAGFANWLNTETALAVRVAEHGDALAPHTVYIAADECHLGVGTDAVIALSRSPPIRGFRPSADFLLESVARAFGASAIAVILSGMGQDGVEGLRAIHDAGGRVVVQDETTSVVFGMPRAAMEAGLADAVLPLPAIAPHLMKLACR